MTIHVWSDFSKRKNSTKQPSGGTSKTVRLKQNCSIESPVFILNEGIANYTYVEAFGHYYFVSDVVNVAADVCEVHCTQDNLATYKAEIGNTSAYILFDTTSNSEQPDYRLGTKTTPTISTNSTALRSDTSEAGAYVVSLTGVKKAGSYVVPRSTLAYLMPDIVTVFDSYIQGTDPFAAIVGAGKQLVGSGQVSQNIRDVRWLPFGITGDTSVPLNVGMYEVYNDNGVHLGGHRIDTRLSLQDTSIAIPWQYGDWRNSEPYTQIYMYIPFVGVVSYPASSLIGQSNIYVHTSLDKITGDLSISVDSGNVVLGCYGASTGVAIALGSSGIGGGNIVNGIITGAAAVASESAAGIASAIFTGCTPLPQSVGGISSGSASGLNKNIKIATVCHNTVVSPSSVSSAMGTPANAVKQIGTLSGYVQCLDASVEINGRAQDRDEINLYLNSGFFYE